MELTELKFAVDTRQLKDAVDLLGEVERGTAALGDAEGKRAPRRKKLTDEEIKAADAAKKLADETKRAASASEATNDKLSKLKDQLAFLRGELVQGETGFTKMQAGMMAAAKATGASEEILKQFAETFDNFNRITGQNPFDKSVGGLKFLESELGRLQKTTELATAGFKLTQQQIKLLSQDTEALTQVNIALGKSEADVGKIISEHTQQFAAKATQLNEQIERSKELERQTKNETLARIKAQDIENKARLDSQALWKKQVSEFAGGGEAYKETMNSMAEFYTRQNEELSKSNSANYWRQEFKNLHEGDAAYKQTMSSMADFYRQQEKEAKKTTGSTAVKTNRELAQSTKWLANEEAKMLSVLNSLNMSQSESNSLNEKASRSIANYERHLKQAGITGKDAADKLALYRDQQAQIQAIEQRNQGKFLTRALQPQIGDVAVSLAAGQNPLTVLLQQGDQVRGLIAQSGVEGAALQKIMRDAFTQTLVSIKDTAVAMSSVVTGAFSNMGKALTGWIGSGLSSISIYNQAIKDLEAGTISQLRFTRLMEVANARLMQSFVALGGMIVGGIVVALGAMGVAAYQAGKQEDALSKSLALTGGSMGLNLDTALGYASALNAAGVSTSKAIDVMTAMGKEGGFLASEIELVTVTAVRMQKDAGVAIEDTVKHFAKLKEKPVEAILELAKSSGMITSASLEAVIALEKQGDRAGAVALAMKISADVQIKQSERIKGELSSLGSVMKWFSEQWTAMWDAIKGTQYQTPIKEQLQGDLIKTQAEINRVKSNLELLAKIGIKGDPTLLNQLNATADSFSKQIQDIDAKSAAEKKLAAEQSKGADITKDKLRLEEDLRKKQESLDKDKLTKQQTINKALENEAKLRKAAGGTLSLEEIQSISKVVGQEYDKSKSKGIERDAKKSQNELNAAMEKYNDIMNIASGYTASYNNDVAQLDLLRKNQSISEEQYIIAMNELSKKQPYWIKLQKEQTEADKADADGRMFLNDLIGKTDGLGKNYYSTLQKIYDLRGTPGIDAEQIEAAAEAFKQATPRAKAYAAVVTDYNKTIDELGVQRQSVKEQYKTDFQTEEQKSALESQAKLEKEYALAGIEYQKNINSMSKDLSDQQRTDAIAKYKEMADERKRLAKDVYDRERYLQSDQYQMYAAGFDALKGLAKDFGSAVTDEFMNFATTGKSSFEALTSSFGNMVQKMIYDLIRLRIQKQVTGLFDQLVSIGIQAMMPSAFGSYKGTGIDPTSLTGASYNQAFKTQANGGAWTNGIQMYAKGGVFDSPTMFQHSGGLGVLGEAGSEAVMPLKRDSSGSLGVVAQVSGSGSATSVVINNYGSDTATATESIDSRGNRSIEVTIGEVAAGSLNKSGSSSQKAMASTYGMKPQLIRR